MSRSSTLTCQSTKVCLVIRKNKEISIEQIRSYCECYCSHYAFIVHKGDIDSSTGEIIPIHYHLVLDYKASKVAFSTRLNDIVKFFNFDNSNGIQIEKRNSLEKSIQYLTHKNQPDKTSHKAEEIIHNYDKGDFELFYNNDVGDVITFDSLYGAVISSNNIIEVIKQLGIGNYRTWRNVVWDIWNEIHKK